MQVFKEPFLTQLEFIAPPKEGHFTFSLGKNATFSQWKSQNKTNNLLHQKVVSVAVFFSLRVGAQHIQTVVQ